MGLNPDTRFRWDPLCFISQQPMRLRAENNHYTICSPLQSQESQFGCECQSCVNTAAVRRPAANLAPLSLQQHYHKKIIILKTHNHPCVHSDNRLHCNISLVTAPILWLLSLDLALHCDVRPSVVQMLLSALIRKLFCETVCSRGQKNRLADYFTQRLQWGLVGWRWMAGTQLARQMDQSARRSSEA